MIVQNGLRARGHGRTNSSGLEDQDVAANDFEQVIDGLDSFGKVNSQWTACRFETVIVVRLALIEKLSDLIDRPSRGEMRRSRWTCGRSRRAANSVMSPTNRRHTALAKRETCE
jgi:hypothetical protein